MERVIGSALIFSFCSGIFLAIVGFFATPWLLELINAPKDVFDEAVLYMRIIFLGQPASLLFNYSAGIFRASGNSKLPMRILMVTGLVNVLLNLFFVLVFHLDSAGVAIATVTANYLSAGTALFVFFRSSGEYRFSLAKLRVFKSELLGMLKIGVPAGLNAILFNFSNVIVSTVANSMGKTVVASISAANSLSNLVHTVGNSFTTALVSFSGQNYGAGKLRRAKESFWKAILLAEMIFFAANLSLTLFPSFFLGLYTSDADVVQTGIPKLLLTCWGYMIYLFAEFANSIKRGFGKTITPMILNIVCVCGFRLFWVWVVFPYLPQTVFWLYLCLPGSWLLTALAQTTDLSFVYKRTWKQCLKEEKLSPEDAAYFGSKLNKKA